MIKATSTRSLVLDLFGGYLRYLEAGEVRLSVLLELLEVFGVEASTARVTLSRLRREGWFTTRRSGRETLYKLSDQMLSVLVEGRERIFTRSDDEWDGCWTQIFYRVPESARGEREVLRKRLTWLGYGQFAPSTWLSPHRGVESIEQLQSDFPNVSIDVLRSTTTYLTGDRELAERCWDLGSLAQSYRDFLMQYAEFDVDNPALPEGKGALVLRTTLAAEMRRLTFRDPDLPIELQPKDWPGREAFDFFRRVYSRLGDGAEAYVETVTAGSLELSR